jgi:hypothetical protein
MLGFRLLRPASTADEQGRRFKEMDMSSSRWFLKLVVVATLLGGCDDKKNATAPQPEDKNKTRAMDDSPKPVVTPKAIDTGLPKSDPDPTPAKPIAPAVPTSREQATKLLDDLKSAIDRGKLGDADANLKKLDAMKDQLPRDLSDRLEALRTAYKAWSAGAR